MAQSTKQTLVIERTFDAPRELVWKAFSDPAMVKRWWGPEGFTSPDAKIDFRVGGSYLFAMQHPEYADGKPIWSGGDYEEIVPMERIVCTDHFADANGNKVSPQHYAMPDDFPDEMRVTFTFEDAGNGKTKFTLRHEGMPAGEQGEMASVGWNQSLDKLAAALANAA
jgi:uncharacterized protein YndB with AHSA1/START domain